MLQRSSFNDARAASRGAGGATTFALCAVAMIAEGFDTYAVGYIGPALVREWGLSQAIVGQLYAVGVVASLFGSVVLGMLSDWLGRKWLLVTAMVAFGLATSWSAFAPDIQTLMISRFVAGLGLGASVPCAMALASNQAPPRLQATTPVLLSACIGLGMVVAGLAAAAVMPHFGWRGILYVGAALPLLVAAAMALLLRDDPAEPTDAAAHSRATPWRLLAQPRTLALSTTLTLGLIATYTVTFFFGFWLPTLVSSVAPDPATVGLATALIKSFSLIGSLCLGFLMDRLGARRVLPWAFVAAATALVTTVGERSGLGSMVLSLAVASFFVDGAFSGIIGFGALVFPRKIRGSGMGITIAVGRLLGGSLGPMLGGHLLAGGASVRMICAAFAGPLLLAAVMVVVAGRIGRRVEAHP